ncbi:hypothetical protein GUJ93_ZPchr0005g15951 [Zizania palustris]|uniref:Uncharacterized protein n=1 Tax=Zizania palustris TaxID=103762 RepID=A0A8J5T9T3_ZIZPA|nr:hypothetical protein GUJ93_ZPchr0005g15951 [Zizania palustris]
MEGRALALSQFCVRVVGSPFLLSVDSGGARGCSGASGRGRVARITPEAYPSSAGRGRAWKRDSPEASPRRAVAAVRLLRIEKGKAFVDLLNEKGNGSGENEMSYVEMKSGAPGATADTTLPESVATWLSDCLNGADVNAILSLTPWSSSFSSAPQATPDPQILLALVSLSLSLSVSVSGRRTSPAASSGGGKAN